MVEADSAPDFRALVEDMEQMVHVCRPDTTIVYVNRAICRFFGRAAEDIIGQRWIHNVPENEQTATLDALAALTPHNPVGEHENTAIRADGTPRQTLWVMHGFFDGEGRMTHLQAVGHDITERRRAEASLRASEQRFRALFQEARDALVVIDRNGRVRDINKAGCRLLGRTYHDLLGRLPDSFVTDTRLGDLPGFFDGIVPRLDRGENVLTETLIHRPDGLDIPVEVSFSLFEEAGAPLFLAALRDISERKQQQRALQDYNDKLETIITARTDELEKANARLAERERFLFDLIDNNATLIFVKDRDGRYELVNRRWEELTGLDRKDVLGCRDSDVFRHVHAPELMQDVSRQDATVLSEGRVLQVEQTFACADGPRVLLVSKFPVLGVDGKPRAVCGIATDITDRKRMESQLAEAKEQAEAATRAKSAFLANMSHEIRTPLNAILGFAEVIKNEVMGPLHHTKYREYAGDIHDSARHLLHVIGNVLDFSKIEAGRLELEEAEFDLKGALDQVAAVTHYRAAEKQLALRFRIASGVPPRVTGDEVRLRQILINLANNAIKFTERGEVCVSVHVVGENGPDGRTRLAFEVRDTGIGIAPEQQALLFQPFSQLDGHGRRTFGGTGLGLAICRQLAELMGGVINVESAVDQGTTFTVTLPFATAGADAELEAGSDA